MVKLYEQRRPGPIRGSSRCSGICQQPASDAEKMATEAEKVAEYHKLRAKELQGG